MRPRLPAWVLASTLALPGCSGGPPPAGGGSGGSVFPPAAAPPPPASGLTPEQQAEIDAAVAAYREANAARVQRTPLPPPPPEPEPEVPASAGPPAPPEPPEPVERVAWLDPGRTGARTPPEAAPPEPEADPPTPPPPPPVVQQAAAADPVEVERLSVPEGPPADAPAGPGYVEIAALELCRSVGGFGVYEPFADRVFTAGAPVRMVLYAEIEGYATDTSGSGTGDAVGSASTSTTTSASGGGGGGGGVLHRVRLSQEVLLFRDADGLMVWSQPPEPITDASRRRRRDFWSVQLVELPANLGVGRYRLKVRITDEVSGTIDERSVPLRLVAQAP